MVCTKSNTPPRLILSAALALVGLFGILAPSRADGKSALPGENLKAAIVDNPAVTNNGEGHDVDDIEELQEHWRKPAYVLDQHRQIAGIAIFGVIVVATSSMRRRQIQSKFDHLTKAN